VVWFTLGHGRHVGGREWSDALVNEWLVAALALLAGLIPCGVVCLRGEPTERLVGLSMAGTIDALVLLLLAVGYRRGIYLDLALALALLTFAGSLVFARFLERWG
jgi:multicomponent Na+:H+ antiporter subunit F